MKLALTCLCSIFYSTSLFAQIEPAYVLQADQTIAYQPAPAETQPNSGKTQPEKVPEPEPKPEPVPQLQTVEQRPTPFQSLLMSRRDFRLARTPPMFGDSLGLGIAVGVSGFTTFGSSTLPLGGGNRRFSVADNNVALPVDRWYFAYNHFHNALNTNFQTMMGSGGRNTSIDQYMFGYERTFGDFQNSLEIRVPFVNDFAFTSPTFGVLGGSVGNIFVNYKRVLAQDENSALSGGAGLGIPTGSNALGYVDNDVFKVENEAFHFNPYLALVGNSDNGGPFFYQAFAQFDIPLNGNDVIVVPLGDPMMEFRAGRLDDKALFHFDIGGGWWLFQGRSDNFIEALAAVLELHYTQNITSADVVTATTFDNFIGISPPFRDARILNLTAGLQAQLAPLVNLRLGMALPLRDSHGKNRVFDAEFLLSLICYR